MSFDKCIHNDVSNFESKNKKAATNLVDLEKFIFYKRFNINM
jgi:hypothetical protein